MATEMTATNVGMLSGTVDTLEAGRRDGFHPGWQVFVAHEGKVVADLAGGEARPGVPLMPDSLVWWMSNTKTVTAVAVAQQWEQGRLGLDDPVSDHIPEFATNGKDRITIRHLLTHTGGIRRADFQPERGVNPLTSSWEERLQAICAASVEPGWEIGRTAGYHPFSGMFLLAEIVRRCDGRPFERYVREELFEPLGLYDSWVGLPAQRFEAYGDRMASMHHVADGVATPMRLFDSPQGAAPCVPAGGGWGPIRELGRFYQMLAGRGQLDGVRILDPQTVEAITARHRHDTFDESQGMIAHWGLGFMVDSVLFGRHCSPRAFGHGGGAASAVFCDPEANLVGAYICNGQPDHRTAYLRGESIASAIYVDLGLVSANDPGRDHELPTRSLGGGRVGAG